MIDVGNDGDISELFTHCDVVPAENGLMVKSRALYLKYAILIALTQVLLHFADNALRNSLITPVSLFHVEKLHV